MKYFGQIELLIYFCSGETIDEVIPRFRCDITVNVTLPCTHVVQLSCADETEIAEKTMPYPKCTEKALTPYMYPDCLHEISCLCHQLKEYKDNPSKVKSCKVKVSLIIILLYHSIFKRFYRKLKPHLVLQFEIKM